MTTPDGLPTVHLDGSLLPPDARLSAFQTLVGYDVFPLEPFEIDSRAWLLEELAVTQSRISAVRIERTPAHILADRRDTYSIIVLQRGTWVAELDDGDVQVATGQIGIIDFARTFRIEGTSQDNIMIVVPRSLVDDLAPGAPPLSGRIIEGAPGRLLADHMFALARHLPDTRAQDVSVVRRATVGLLAVVLSGLPQQAEAPGRNARRGVAAKVLAYVEERLTDPQLSVATICRDIAASRSTLYRIFQPTGGIEAYVQQRRLEAAHARLCDERERTSISEIADLYCFSSPAHFSTAFRRRFGYTPLSARGAGASLREAGQIFDNWREGVGSFGVPDGD